MSHQGDINHTMSHQGDRNHTSCQPRTLLSLCTFCPKSKVLLSLYALFVRSPKSSCPQVLSSPKSQTPKSELPRVQTSGFRVQGLGFRVKGLGFNPSARWGRISPLLPQHTNQTPFLNPEELPRKSSRRGRQKSISPQWQWSSRVEPGS